MNKIKVLYGCCYKAELNLDANIYEITYVDIIPDLFKSNGMYICTDIKDIKFKDFDIIVCSPPCNYWTRAISLERVSDYALNTMCLLPYCINECVKSGKPFIIENVRNYKRFNIFNLFNYPCFYVFIGRHTYRTNRLFKPDNLQIKENITHISKSKRQGGNNVNTIFEEFIKSVL